MKFNQAVLERGVLNYYPSRADSTGMNKNKRRDYKYLDSARISILPTMTSFIVHFSDGSLHRLSVVSNDEVAQVERQVNTTLQIERTLYINSSLNPLKILLCFLVSSRNGLMHCKSMQHTVRTIFGVANNGVPIVMMITVFKILFKINFKRSYNV